MHSIETLYELSWFGTATCGAVAQDKTKIRCHEFT